MGEHLFRPPMPHEYEPFKPHKRDVPLYVERVKMLEAAETALREQLAGAVAALRIAREYVEASDLRQSSVDLSVIDEARFGGQ